MSVFTKTFWRDTTERVVASAAGGALAALGADAVDVLQVDGLAVLGVAGGAALVSLLKALVASRIGSPSSASLDPAV